MRRVIYVSIGNSDDKLTQQEWSAFVRDVRELVKPKASITHGEWFSAPDAPWQNACWCLEFPNDNLLIYGVQEVLSSLCETYRQESIAWAETEVTVFLEAPRRESHACSHQPGR